MQHSRHSIGLLFSYFIYRIMIHIVLFFNEVRLINFCLGVINGRAFRSAIKCEITSKLPKLNRQFSQNPIKSFFDYFASLTIINFSKSPDSQKVFPRCLFTNTNNSIIGYFNGWAYPASIQSPVKISISVLRNN